MNDAPSVDESSTTSIEPALPPLPEEALPAPMEAQLGGGPASPEHAQDGSANVELERLVGAVLDAAGVANRSTEIAASSTRNLLDAVDNLEQSHQRANRKALIVVGITGGLLLLALICAITMAVIFAARLRTLDETMHTLSGHSADIGARVERLEGLDELLGRIEKAQASQSAIASLEAKVDAGFAALAKSTAEIAARPTPRTPAPAAASSGGADLRALDARLHAMEGQLQTQARAAARLADLYATGRGDAARLSELSKSVEAIAQAQRQLLARPIAPMAAPPAPAERPKPPEPRREFVQYPPPPTNAEAR